MGDHKEQRGCMKFCFLLEKTAAETIVMLQQAFKDDAFGKSQVYQWFSRFKNGNMSIEDLPRPGRPSTSRNEKNIEKVRQVINEDRRKTVEQVSEETNVSWSSCQRILTEGLRMRRVSAKFVPRLLTEEQEDNCVNLCRDLMEELCNDPNFLTKIVTGDESWCYAYDLLCSLRSPITIIVGCCE
jgi:histone-lysine N-methyltransferase SETMAR